MALIVCKECGENVSKNAKACPNCGEPVPKGTSAFTAIVVLLIAFGIYSASTRNSIEASRELPAVAKTPAQLAAELKESQAKQARYGCKQFIEERLHDPANAEFPTWTSSFTEQRPKDWLVQMEVRAKNGFNATRFGLYNCVVTVSGDNVKIVSLKQQK